MSNRLFELMKKLYTELSKRKRTIIALSAVVVFVTTYALILPAFTLEKNKAAEQGGIDVPVAEQVEDADTADADAKDVDAYNSADAADAKDDDADKKDAKVDESPSSGDISLTFETDDYTVAVAGTDADLHEEMSVEVSEIDKTDKEQKKEYDSLYKDALKAVQEEKDGKNVSDFAFAKFYDITLMDGNDAVEPGDAVDVTISYEKELQKELAKAAGAIDPERVRIVHFAEDKETGEITPQVLAADDTDITVEDDKVTEATFKADGFSVYAVVYTVDFEYEVDGQTYTYSIPGGSSIALSSLLSTLNVTGSSKDDAAADMTAFMNNIEKVEFSDPELVSVEKDGDDWTLTSLKPFTSEEKLTVTMKNGDVFDVKVTDAQESQAVLTWNNMGGYGRNGVVNIHFKDLEGNNITLTDPEYNSAISNNDRVVLGGSSFIPTVEGYNFDHAEWDGNTVDEFVCGIVDYSTITIYKSDTKVSDVDLWYNSPTDFYLYYEKDNTEPGDEPGGGDSSDANIIWEDYDGWEFLKINTHYATTDGTSLDDKIQPYNNQIENKDVINLLDPQYNQSIEGYKLKNIIFDGTEITRMEAVVDTDIPSSTGYKIYFYNGKDLVKTLDLDKENYTMDIHFNYEESTNPGGDTPGGGDTPTPTPGEEVDEGEFPHHKTLTPNLAENGEWDGTYTLSLDIVGKKKSAESASMSKADIILVLDMSSSMTDNSENGKTRFEIEQAAVRKFGYDLLAKNDSNPDTIRMTMITFGNTAHNTAISNETDKDKYTKAVDALPPPPTGEGGVQAGGQGTNWEDSLQKAEAVSTREDAEKFVIFVSDGRPTLRNTPDNPTAMEKWLYGKIGAYGPGVDTVAGWYTYLIDVNRDVRKCYENAKDEARNIVSSGKKLYTISVFENLTMEDGSQEIYDSTRDGWIEDPNAGFNCMEALLAYAYNDGGVYPEGCYNTATTAGELSSIFSELFETASQAVQYQNVKITDELTVATKSTLQISGHANDFKYYKNDEEWPVSEADGDGGAPAATYNNGQVDWDLSSLGPLEDGVTYKVAFTVWPNQDAYDLILKLNEAESEEEKNALLNDPANEDVVKNLTVDPETGKYVIYSNGDAKVSYQKATSDDGETFVLGDPQEMDYPRPTMKTLQYKMKVAKVWKDSLYANNRPTSIKFNIYEDGEFYKRVTLTEANAVSDSRWEAEIPISPGIISNKIIADDFRLNGGHTYTVEEALDAGETSDYHYDFDPEELLPFLHDGVMKFEGDLDGDESLSGTNHMRGSMTITKKVINDAGEDISSDADVAEQNFKFKVYLRDPNGQEITGKTADDEDAIWYRLLDAEGNEIGSSTVINSGDVFILKAGHSLRLLNLPRTMKYKVEEIDIPDGYVLDSEEYDYVDEDNDPEVQLIPDEDGFCEAQPNTWQYVTVTNKKPEPGSLKIRKFITENGESASDAVKTKLAGEYSFGIFTDEECKKELLGADGTPVKVSLTMGSDGAPATSAEVTNLKPGDYWIKEVLPTNGSLPVENPVKVTVEAGKTGDDAVVADFTNNYETTKVKVKKVWTDPSGTKNHSQDKIKFTLYWKAIGENGAVLREGEYTGDYDNEITGTGEAVVENLPAKGSVDDEPVEYQYYVVETQGVDNYVPITGQQFTEDGTELTIDNIGPADPDDPTSLSIKKVWKDAEGRDVTASGHDNDTIEFKLRQKIVRTEYIPVTLILSNQGNQRITKQYYVKPGDILNLTVAKGSDNPFVEHSVTIKANNSLIDKWGPTLDGSKPYEITINRETTITAELNYHISIGILNYYDNWGIETLPGSAWDPGVTWTASVSGDTPMEQMVAEAKSADTDIDYQEFIYELKKGQLDGGIFTNSVTGWTGTISDLPQFKKIGDSVFYAYSYTIDEVSVNGEPVTNKSTDENGVITGTTSEYSVTVDPSNYTITNQERPKIEVSANKKWVNADKTETAPANAKVTFELYADGKATGKIVELDGTEATDAEQETGNYESAAWTATWKNLPEYKDLAKTEKIVYTVREVSGFAPYINQNPEGVEVGETTIGTITNMLTPIDLKILKVDKENHASVLRDATFELTRIKSDEAPGNQVKHDGDVISTVTTNDYGEAVFTGLAGGYYEIKESRIPAGYIISDTDVFYIFVDSNGVKLIECDMTKPATEWDTITSGGIVDSIVAPNGNTPAKATVVNEPGPELPHTGGIGTTFFYIFGALLVIGGAVTLTIRRRTKASRS